MKYSILIFLTLLHTSTKAHNYYFSNTMGDDSRTIEQAQNDGTPWKTINKLNSLTILKSGDSILFKRGDTFYGSISTERSGSLGNPINYDAYGDGSKPIITGFTKISSWKLLGKNIYYVSLDVPTLNLVTLDGNIKPMGRYPNTGYLSYTTHDENKSISGPSIRNIPFDPTGYEVVIRKDRYIIDRHSVTSIISKTLNYAVNNDYGNSNTYSPIDGNGFFIQNGLNTLDQEGDWFYDTAVHRLYMYFTTSPMGKVIKASSLNNNFRINSQHHINVSNLDFEGSNTTGLYLVGASNINISACKFIYNGGNAVWGGDVTDINMTNDSIYDCLNNGVFIEYSGKNVSFNYGLVHNAGLIVGASRSGDAAMEGIALSGNHNAVMHSTITNSGYNAIAVNGDSAIIGFNFIDSFCLFKDDGGGVYTYKGIGAVINNNIITHAKGAYSGGGLAAFYYEPFGKVAGIYLDDGTAAHHALVANNVLAHGEWAGIFNNNNGHNTFIGNTVFDFAHQMQIFNYTPGVTRNMLIQKNTFIARTADQSTFLIINKEPEHPSLFGLIDSNYYARPIKDDSTIWVAAGAYIGAPIIKRTLNDWAAFSGLDIHSYKSSISTLTTNNFIFNYNKTQLNVNVPINGIFKDIPGELYSSEVILTSFSGKVLINTNAAVLPLQILNLKGKSMENCIKLEFNTTISNDIAFFEVERSDDGIKFEKLNRLYLSSHNRYAYDDCKPFNSINYYRIKQINKDGKFFYSNVCALNFTALRISISPNPTANFINIEIDKNSLKERGILTIRSSSGELVKRINFTKQNYNRSLDVSSFTKGTYFLHLESENNASNRTFIKL